MVRAGGMHRISSAGADAENPDAGRVDAGDRGESVDRVGDVLTAAVRVLEVAGLTAALTLMGGIERERRDAPGGEAGCVIRADLLLYAAAGSGEHHGARRRGLVDDVGQVEVGRELDRPARDRDVLRH
jgi:hypothetical protein